MLLADNDKVICSLPVTGVLSLRRVNRSEREASASSSKASRKFILSTINEKADAYFKLITLKDFNSSPTIGSISKNDVNVVMMHPCLN